MPLHYGTSGSPDRLGPRGEVFLLPLIGLLTLLINGALGSVLYRQDRVGSYLLWGGSILVHLLVWTATLGVLARV
jgi:lipopolysaccharide export LptBFGC system permease protein LptF